MNINFRDLLSIAIKAAVLGGKEILEVYTGAITVELKEDNSPLTEADRRANFVIEKELKQTSLPFLSEEGKNIPYEVRRDWNLFWLVDPLDGTKEFINRNGEFTVNIALIIDSKPCASVVYAPAKDVLYFGSDEIGSFKLQADIEHLLHLIQTNLLLDRIIKVSDKLPISSNDRAFTIVASRSHLSDETAAYIEASKLKHGKIEMISQGSSLKLCLVAEGTADVYPRFAPTMEWDIAAGHAIVANAGGTVNNFETQTSLTYNKPDLLNPWFIVEN